MNGKSAVFEYGFFRSAANLGGLEGTKKLRRAAK